jgi:hypothetical protein
MPTNDYTATNANGVQFALTYHSGFLADYYDLVITFPDSTTATINNIPPDNVLTSDGTINTTLSLAGSYAYVIPPGVSGNVEITASALTQNTVYVGGTATAIDADLALGSSLTIDVYGGSAQAASGVLVGALSDATVNLDDGGSFGNGSALISILNGTTINFQANGGNFIANTGGATVDLSSLTINGFDNAKDSISFTDLSDLSPVKSYTIMDSGTSQVITSYDTNGTEIASVTVSGLNFPTGTYQVAGSGPMTVSEDGSTLKMTAEASAACFLAGTRIRTKRGDVPVERLQAGDMVLTLFCGFRPVKAMQSRRYAPARATRPEKILPIRIMQGALGQNVPERDLYVSPDHAIYFDGVLIPAQLLVNGESIIQTSPAGTLVYFHIELDPHQVIFAEGAAAESYLDIGIPGYFRERNVFSLFPAAAPKTWEDACAPLLLTGPELKRIQDVIKERARECGQAAPAGLKVA